MGDEISMLSFFASVCNHFKVTWTVSGNWTLRFGPNDIRWLTLPTSTQRPTALQMLAQRMLDRHRAVSKPTSNRWQYVYRVLLLCLNRQWFTRELNLDLKGLPSCNMAPSWQGLSNQRGANWISPGGNPFPEGCDREHRFVLLLWHWGSLQWHNHWDCRPE